MKKMKRWITEYANHMGEGNPVRVNGELLYWEPGMDLHETAKAAVIANWQRLQHTGNNKQAPIPKRRRA